MAGLRPRCTVVLRVCRWAEPDWALWGGTYGLLVADALATGAMPSATAACLAAIVAPDADVLQPMAAATGPHQAPMKQLGMSVRGSVMWRD